MAEAKKTYPKFTSPKLKFKFPKVAEPDYGSTDYPKPDGEFSLRGVASLDDPMIKAFIDKLSPHYDEAVKVAAEEFAKLKVETRKKLGEVKLNDLYTTLYDQETEEPTGEIEFKFAMKYSGQFKKGPKTGQFWTRYPDLFDAKGQPIKGTVQRDERGNVLKDKAGKPIRKFPSVWGGTIGRISFEASPYFIPGTGAAGLKLNLNGVQVIDLVSEGSRNASSHGFGAEDGYSYEEEDEALDGASEEGGEGTETDGSNEDF